MTILVTGGTGTIGRQVVSQLTGHEVRVLSRRPGPVVGDPGHVLGDTVADRGLAEAVQGVDTVLHLAGGAKGDDVAARNISRAARAAGVQHLVFISVIGADRMPIGYFRAKAAAEQAIMTSGVPWTLLRSAQLHSFVLPVARFLTKLPLVPAPTGLRFEPVDVASVATRLTELTLGSPAGRVPDIAGPEVLEIREVLAQYLAARVRRRALVRVPMPGAAGRAYRAGHNLAADDALRLGTTWHDFLLRAYPARPDPSRRR